MNIEKCLNNYCDAFYHEFWGINHQLANHEVLMQQAIVFLNQYAMNKFVYKDVCTPVMQKIFKVSPSEIFDIRVMPMTEMIEDGFDYFSYHSSPLLWKESYELIQKVCAEYGDKYIFIVEEEECESSPDSAFKLRIPVCKSWEELSNGGYISDVLFNRPNCNYYVFGDSGMWGKWCDYDNNNMDYETFCYKHITPSVSEYKTYFSEYLITFDHGDNGVASPDHF